MLSNDEKSKRIDQGIRKGIADALARHKLLGEDIAVWKDGKVVTIPAKKIRVLKTK